ncbi:MAG: C40 family peptidase [Oscillospiraceae bacterium]
MLMKIMTKRTLSFVLSAVMFVSAVLFFLPINSSADNSCPAPVLSEYAVFGNRISLSIDNADEYSSSQLFDIYVSGRLIKTIKLPSSAKINLYDNGRYFKPNTNYTIAVEPKGGAASSIKVRTESLTYYLIAKDTPIYKLSNGKMKKKTTAAAKNYAVGELCTDNGKAIAGLSVKSCTGSYVKLTSGDHMGYYVKCADTSRARRVTAQRYIVSQYGKSMHGGRYASGCASYRYTDCSGLTMQCYDLIGMNITHSVYLQAQMGKRVSLNNMQPGDLIILNYRSHVAMYIGNGKMVHAMNYYDGIQVQPISKLQYYHVDTVRRLIY